MNLTAFDIDSGTEHFIFIQFIHTLFQEILFPSAVHGTLWVNTDNKRTLTRKSPYYPAVVLSSIKWTLRINVSDTFFIDTKTKAYNLKQQNGVNVFIDCN